MNTPPTRSEIRSLTGLRGVAACLVVLHHLLEHEHDKNRFELLSLHLYVCVDVFFVLSGFVLAMNYWSPSGMNRVHFRTFVGRRFARIYPLHFVVTAVCLILMAAGLLGRGNGSLPHAVVTNALLIAAWGFGPYVINHPAWSISTEAGAYLLFPVLGRLTLSSRCSWAIVAAVGAVAGLYFLGSLPDAAFDENGRGGPLAITNPNTLGPLARCIGDFTLGLLAWRAANNPAITAAVAGLPCIAGALSAAVVLLLARRMSDVPIIVLSACLCLALSSGTSWTARCLASPIPWFLGLISYSIYLVHWPVIATLDALHLQDALTNAGVACAWAADLATKLSVTLLLSCMTYRWIEKPGRVAARHLLEHAPRRIGSNGLRPEAVKQNPVGS